MTTSINSESGELEINGFPAFFIGKITHFYKFERSERYEKRKDYVEF
jgi:hypothetical protein